MSCWVLFCSLSWARLEKRKEAKFWEMQKKVKNMWFIEQKVIKMQWSRLIWGRWVQILPHLTPYTNRLVRVRSAKQKLIWSSSKPLLKVGKDICNGILAWKVHWWHFQIPCMVANGLCFVLVLYAAHLIFWAKAKSFWKKDIALKPPPINFSCKIVLKVRVSQSNAFVWPLIHVQAVLLTEKLKFEWNVWE